MKNSEKRYKNRSFLRSVRNSRKKCGKRSVYDNKMIGKMGAEKIEKYENVRMETKKNKAATLLEGLQPYLSFCFDL